MDTLKTYRKKYLGTFWLSYEDQKYYKIINIIKSGITATKDMYLVILEGQDTYTVVKRFEYISTDKICFFEQVTDDIDIGLLHLRFM